MEIPVTIRQARDLFFGNCNKNYSCVYEKLAIEEPKLPKARAFFQGRAEDDANEEIGYIAYRESSPSKQSEKLAQWSLKAVYKGFDDTVYSGAKAQVPELTGVAKVRVGEAAQEYMYGKTGYLCDKVE